MAKPDRVLLCSCAGTMKVDARIAEGMGGVKTCRELCGADVDLATEALAQDGLTLIACGQQAGFFADIAEEIGAKGELLAVDIRDRAGWTADAAALPKQAALLAEALLPRPATPVRAIVSEGTCLVIGAGELALGAARRLSEKLAVTCLLDALPEDTAPEPGFDIATGRISKLSGSLAGFSVSISGYAPLLASGRGAAKTDGAADASSSCDIVLDLSGDPARFKKRDGYLRADPRDPVAVERAIFDAGELQGTFEKPLYVRLDAGLCAHSRARKTGCTRCLDACPTGAITPAGDHVSVDSGICAGCGACAAQCPSGAISWDDPPVDHLYRRLHILAQTYREAGGKAPRALFHDGFGEEMIRLSARFGRGLPANVIPVSVYNVEGVGHAEILAALGVGFAEAILLAGPAADCTVPRREMALAEAIAGEGRMRLIEPVAPDDMEDLLYGTGEAAPTLSLRPIGGRREATRLVATGLLGECVTALPQGAPYGEVSVDTDACTLCLACVSLCPSGALGDNPDRPQLRFQEAACLQCGICASACPEKAITLVPQLDTRPDALRHRVLHEEEPFACIECGKAFGVRSTIERIVEKLEGRNWMYTNSDNTRLIRMCDDCRVRAQAFGGNNPMQFGERPVQRRTEDYLEERKKPQ